MVFKKSPKFLKPENMIHGKNEAARWCETAVYFSVLRIALDGNTYEAFFIPIKESKAPRDYPVVEASGSANMCAGISFFSQRSLDRM